MKKFLQIANIASVIFAILANAYVATSSSLPSIASVSAQYETLLNPATYAFSVWTVIYVGMFILALYQARDLMLARKENQLPQKLSGWFIFANIMNGIWTYIFVSGYIGLSVVVILSLLTALSVLLSRLHIAVYDAPLKTIAFIWWPLMLYSGWVLVASIVNTASLLSASGIMLSPLASAVTIALLGVGLSLLLNKRNVRLMVLASTWGIVGIAVAQFGITPIVWKTAIVVSFGLLLHTSIHGYRNRSTSPISKLREG